MSSQEEEEQEEYLKELYYDISKPTAYSNAEAIFLFAKNEGKKISRGKVRNFLRKQDTYGRNR